MSKDSKHTVTIYTNHQRKEFSISRREDNHAHHSEIAALEKSKGFEVSVVARGISETAGNLMKSTMTQIMENAGYHRVTRESIPGAIERLGMLPTRAFAQGII